MPRRRSPLRLHLGITLISAGSLTWYLSQERGWHAAAAWLTSLNLLVLPLWGFDKTAARRGWTRVPELVLHVCAALGAVPASFFAMQVFRHKTLKPKFRRLYYTFFAIQAIGALLWLEPAARPW
ncbi:MAG: DUF1294 domain-containing protein [Planctomycetota bacterium]|nr:DUF1294 domain-containing protein [Planctomycetota bacterium]